MEQDRICARKERKKTILARLSSKRKTGYQKDRTRNRRYKRETDNQKVRYSDRQRLRQTDAQTESETDKKCRSPRIVIE